ncbi:MAG: YdcH family protein [Paracoccaceae bacterium]
MSHTPHELAAEFPDRADAIHALKDSDPHFAQLSDSYHRLNRDIHRAETDVEPCADHVLHDMKRRRLAMLDEIKARLATI